MLLSRDRPLQATSGTCFKFYDTFMHEADESDCDFTRECSKGSNTTLILVSFFFCICVGPGIDSVFLENSLFFTITSAFIVDVQNKLSGLKRAPNSTRFSPVPHLGTYQPAPTTLSLDRVPPTIVHVQVGVTCGGAPTYSIASPSTGFLNSTGMPRPRWRPSASGGIPSFP